MGRFDEKTCLDYFEKLLFDGLNFKRWLFGHYHINRQILGKYICIYEQFVQIA